MMSQTGFSAATAVCILHGAPTTVYLCIYQNLLDRLDSTTCPSSLPSRYLCIMVEHDSPLDLPPSSLINSTSNSITRGDNRQQGLLNSVLFETCHGSSLLCSAGWLLHIQSNESRDLSQEM